MGTHRVDGPILIRSSSIQGLFAGSNCSVVELDDGRLGFLGSDNQWIRTINAGTWSTRVDLVTETERRTPTWAIVLGIIGLLFFLLGALLFLVKENRPVQRYVLNIGSEDGELVGLYTTPTGPTG